MSESQNLLPLVQIEQHKVALLFANYLNTLNIEAKVMTAQVISENAESKQGYTVYCQAGKIEQAKTEFKHFIKQPFDQKYQQAAWHHGEAVSLKSDELTLLTHFKVNFLAHAGIVTLVVFTLCWLVFLARQAGNTFDVFILLQFYPRLSLNAFIAEPWRIIGPIFIHFSLLHIVFNTMWWWQLGGSIEKTLGKGVLVNVLLASAIFSNVGQFLVSGANFGGLSGVVYGLVGFVWWYGYLAPNKGLSLSKPIVVFLLLWLVLGFLEVLPINMANTAHLLGLITGCLIAVYHVNTTKKEY